MKMKHFHSIILACCIMMLAIATASADERRASDMFESTYVITGSDLYTEFGASTRRNADSIYVLSCTLQEMDDDDNVIDSTSLTPPSLVVHDTSNFTADATYSGTPGKRYRIKAVFYADGYTVTSYSRIVTYR